MPWTWCLSVCLMRMYVCVYVYGRVLCVCACGVFETESTNEGSGARGVVEGKVLSQSTANNE
eukprot:m.149237 g.149237  ORF g.149237 m.149237 type:complete len:62 (-) comp14203_c0_seq2:483-668(-)